MSISIYIDLALLLCLGEFVSWHIHVFVFNYIPISLLPIIPKVIEQVMQNQMRCCSLSVIVLINSNQCGHSTEYATTDDCETTILDFI